MIDLEIKKPLWANYICIRESYLLSGPQMKVKIPQGEAIIDCKEWMKTRQEDGKGLFIRE